MSDFYITLPSSSSKSEFLDNRSNSYKIRLPNVIRLSGSGWKVRLASVALPDTNVDLTRFKSYPKPLMRGAWGMTDPADTSLWEALFATIEVSDMWHDTNITDGVSCEPSSADSSRFSSTNCRPIKRTRTRIKTETRSASTSPFAGKART